MDEQQSQQIIKLLKGNKKTLKIISTMVGFTLGLIPAIHIIRLF